MKQKLFRKRTIVSRCDVTLQGPARVSGYTVIGGNFCVKGDFECVGPLLCLGRVRIDGDLKCGDALVAGCGLEVTGDFRGRRVTIWEGFDDEGGLEPVADEIFADMPKPPKPNDEWIWRWEHLADQDALTAVVIGAYPLSLQVGGDCVCGDVRSVGHIDVGGTFNPDDVDALGYSISAKRIVVEGDADCGSLSSTGEIVIDGDLRCIDVECARLKVYEHADVDQIIRVTGCDRREDQEDAYGDSLQEAFLAESGHDAMNEIAPEHLRASLECGSIRAGSVSAAGSIRAEGPIECQGYVKAARSIIAGGAVTAGKRHGVVAGLGIPRDQWLVAGYVCAPQKPARILTGVYRPLGRRRGLVLKPARIPRPPRAK